MILARRLVAGNGSQSGNAAVSAVPSIFDPKATLATVASNIGNSDAETNSAVSTSRCAEYISQNEWTKQEPTTYLIIVLIQASIAFWNACPANDLAVPMTVRPVF